MNTEYAQIKLRLPADLKDKLTALARQNKRSVNAEIILCIEHAMKQESSSDVPMTTSADELANIIINKVSKITTREAALTLLEPKEQELMLFLSQFPKNKRVVMLDALLNLIQSLGK